MNLHDYIASYHARRFAYGRADCALFAARWVQLRTGRDLTRGIQYRSLSDGLAQLRALGFADAVAVADADLPSVPVLRARVGDLAVIAGPLGPALGIVLGETVAGLTRLGVGTVPLTAASRAYRVGA